jgi:hypothetical protein
MMKIQAFRFVFHRKTAFPAFPKTIPTIAVVPSTVRLSSIRSQHSYHHPLISETDFKVSNCCFLLWFLAFLCLSNSLSYLSVHRCSMQKILFNPQVGVEDKNKIIHNLFHLIEVQEEKEQYASALDCREKEKESTMFEIESLIKDTKAVTDHEKLEHALKNGLNFYEMKFFKEKSNVISPKCILRKSITFITCDEAPSFSLFHSSLLSSICYRLFLPHSLFLCFISLTSIVPSININLRFYRIY